MQALGRAFVAFLGIAALVGCQSTPAVPTPQPPPPFSAADVDAAITTLSDAGIAVRVRPTDEPIRAVPSVSRVGLLRFQARNLALEASQRSGTLGAEIDALTTAAGGLPGSVLVVGWARTANTPASRAAATLLGDVSSRQPDSVVIPGLAIALFLADITAGSAPAQGVVGRALAAIAGEPPAGGDDFCAQVSSYLSAVLEGVLDPQLALQPAWLQQVIDVYDVLENDPQRLRNSVAAMALLVYATSISRPWTAFLVASPQEVHYLVGEEEEDPLTEREGELASGTKELRLAVARGEESFAEEASECAAIAGLQLEEHELEGTSVLWVVPALLPHTVDFEGDLELDDSGHAIAGYQLHSETPEAHRNGTLNTAVPGVSAIVKREELGELESVVRGLLGGGQLGVAAPTVAAAWDRLSPDLVDLLYPRGSAYVTVTWHSGPEPSPSPSPTPPDEGRIPCADGCAMSNGDPHIVTVDEAAYDFQAAGEFVLLRSADGAIEIQGRQEPFPGSDNVTINTATAMRLDGHRVAFYADTQTDTLRGLLDGAELDASAPTDVGGGRVRPLADGGAFEVEFPDGTYAYALSLGQYGINVLVEPSDALAADGRGIMGPVPDGSWAPSLPDGSALGAEPPDLRAYWEQLYVRFAEAWRVSQETSVFDYADGESTATFAVPGYPAPEDLVQLDDLTEAQRAAGEAACVDVVDPVLHAQCVFDVGITADAGFAGGYESTLTLIETGALPSTGAQARVVNLYTENGQPVEVDVYAYGWSAEQQREVAALVATVPYGQVSGWFNPGLIDSPFADEPSTRVEIFRRGEQTNSLAGIGEFLGPGTSTTIAIWQEEVFEGEPGAWTQTIYEEHPEYPVPRAPAGQGLLLTRDVGLRAAGQSPFLYLSVGDGCLESPTGRVDPEIPNAQPLGNDLVVPVGSHMLTLHDAPEFEIPTCDNEPVGLGAPIEVGPGQRLLVFPFAPPGSSEIRLLVVPLGS